MSIAEKVQKGFSEVSLPFVVKAGTGILAAFLFSLVVLRILYPFDLGYLEAFSWMPATHLLEGKNPYAFAFTPPYSMTPYGIVYYALLAAGLKLFGLELWWGRLLTTLAFAVCLWAVAKITGKLTERREAVWVACLVGLALFPGQAWIAVLRSDFIALACAFAAVALAWTFEKDKPAGAARFAAVLFLSIAAVFTKHTNLLPVGIIVLRFWQLNKWRAGIVFGALFSICAALGMFLLNYTSDGGYFWQHFAHAQRLPFTGEKLAAEIFTIITAPTSVVFLIFLLVLVYRKRAFLAPRNGTEFLSLLRSPQLLIWFYFLLSFIAAMISAGRVGANVNYYLENSLVAAIASGLIYDEFRKNAYRKTALAMIVLFVLGGAFQLMRFARGEYFRWQSLAYYREISETSAGFAPAGSICFSVYVELVARNGCQFYFDDYGEYIGDWSPELSAIFEREVKDGRFAVVIWKTDDFQATFPNYELKPMTQKVPQRVIPVYLYVRKTAQ